MTQQLAFPGAEGFGRFASGGRGGSVIEVTNLNDSGPGSLRAAVQDSSGPRTVVFRVSGNIVLNSRLRLKNDNITIAGQTAPGDGICLQGYDFYVDADNVILRYMRFRLGDEKAVEADALGGRDATNVIIDHCSVSWSVDEAASFYDNTNFTMQWCLISESLTYSVHSKNRHGYGGIWGGMGASFHHNLLAHHYSRNPRFQGSRSESTPETEIVDHRNNAIYNWDGNSAYGGEAGNHNMVANYYKYGPVTESKRSRIVEPSDELGRWYITDNFVFGDPAVTADNWDGGVDNVDISKVRVFDPFPFGPVITHSAETAFQLILADVGASLKRDSIDLRIIHETRTGTATYGGLSGAGTGLIDSQTEVGGWPVLQTYDVPEDNDKDGMADAWELDNGLNPNDPSDRNGDFNGDGYTNLEKYLNELCVRDDFIVAPAELSALALSDTEIKLQWKENAPNETGFSIERSENDTSGFAVITTTGPGITQYTDSNLQRSSLYYYRVRAFNDQVNSLHTNIAYTLTLDSAGVPLPVSNPSPVDSAKDVNLMAQLKWQAAPGATSYNLYLGTTSEPEFIGSQTATIYNSSGWRDNMTYFWRVDAVNDKGTSPGPLWQFTTIKLPPELMAHWRMDRGYGTLAVDASGNSNHASLQNMPEENWVKGIMGTTGLYFNGEQQHLKAGHRAAIDFQDNSFCITLWIRTSSSGKIQPLVSKAVLDSDVQTNGYQLYLNDAGKIVFHVQDSVHHTRLTNDESSVNSGEWEFMAVIRDVGTRQLRLYHNGMLITSGPDSTANLTNNGPLYIAANALQQDFYSGIIDDVRIYQNVLSDQQIENMYQTGVAALSENEYATVPNDLTMVNYPNPFNNQTTIKYTLPLASDVEIVIFNVLGEIVVRYIEPAKQAGIYSWHFDAEMLSSGVYLCRLRAGQSSVLTKMILIK